MLSIPGGRCDVQVVVGTLASWCLILYSMMILEWRRRCCSVGRSRCWSMVVTCDAGVSIVVLHDTSG